MLGTLGPTELLIILAIVVVLFGASRLAGLGGALALADYRGDALADEARETRVRASA